MLFTPTKYVHIQKSWHIILLWHAQASFVPPRWMLILSILEEQVRSGASRKGNSAAVHRPGRWQRQLSSAALTQIPHEKAQMLNRNDPFLPFLCPHLLNSVFSERFNKEWG